MAFQPVMGRRGQVVGFEGLLRWSPSGRSVAPDVFIAKAEQTGLIHELGWEGLTLGLRALSSWVRQSQFGGFLSLNVSPMQLSEPGFDERLFRVMRRLGICPAQVVLEITESTVVDDTLSACRLMRRLKAHGVRLALDDFGTGYAALSQLYKMPFDIVKLDRSFLEAIRNPRGKAVFCGVVDLARQLGCELIIEGIETESHLAFVERSCSYLGLQGFYFHRPLDGRRTSDMVARLAPTPVEGRMSSPIAQ